MKYLLLLRLDDIRFTEQKPKLKLVRGRESCTEKASFFQRKRERQTVRPHYRSGTLLIPLPRIEEPNAPGLGDL